MIDVYESQRTPSSMEGLRRGGGGGGATVAQKSPRAGIHLDLIYVTERIISISFPTVGVSDSAYRSANYSAYSISLGAHGLSIVKDFISIEIVSL